MAERKPLAGWVDCELPAHPSAMTLSVEPTDNPDDPTEWVVDGQYCVSARVPGGTVAARIAACIAAEDAARALVAEMAAALGGSVTWGDAQEVSE